VLDANQLRRLVALGDPGIDALVRDRWGTVREGRNPDRERVVDEMRTLATTTKGDPARGEAVFTRVCATCHRLHGRGAEVGPDITANGRASFDQLLSNLFDPSLVIGAAYQSWTVVTDEGRAITGLLAEESPERIVLRLPGGTAETIPRSAIDVLRRNETSLMPEGLERQCSREELADLLAYLSLDRPPADPAAQPIPGAPGR
jgi:putative heme-binding domain-containing protein